MLNLEQNFAFGLTLRNKRFVIKIILVVISLI